MVCCGDPDLWADLFPENLVPDIIDLVVNTWGDFPSPAADELEVPITRRFCCELIKRQEARLLPFRIEPESSVLDVDLAEEKGRIDIRLSHGYRHNVYFAIECKRLNVFSKGKRRSLAGEYVDEGMTRFVTGKYAKDLDKGAMVGYVMDGKLGDAIKSVQVSIEGRRSELRMTRGATLMPSTIRPKLQQVKQTEHKQGKTALLIHHIFLSVR